MSKSKAQAKRIKVENRIVALSALTPHARNYNKHSDAQINDLRASLQQFGQVRSIVAQADKTGKRYTIVAGHGIADAAAREGYTELRADIIPHDWSPTRVLAYLAADNELGKHADPDAEQLAAIVRDVMAAEGEALARLAAGERAALDAILAGEAQAETADVGELIDKAAELQKKWGVVRGDIWECGRHRLVCGDSTSAEDVAKLMQGERAAITFTSPPYNAGKTPTELKMGTDSKYAGESDSKSAQDYLKLITDATARALDVSKFAVFNLQMLSGNKGAIIDYLFTFKEHLADIAIWDKQRAQPAMAENVLNSQFEFLFIFSAKMNPSRSVGTERFRGTVSNVYSAPPQSGNEFAKAHSATFPNHLPMWGITHFTKHDETAIDLFNGSGTTLVACEQTGRIGRGMEIEPKYVAVSLERLSLLGLKPRRVESIGHGKQITANSETESQNGRQTRHKSRVARQSAAVS